MIIRHATIVPYSRSLPRPITTAHQTYSARDGLILALRGDNGEIGLGDCAPLPGFSHETIDEAHTALSQIARSLEGQTTDEFLDVPKARDEFARDGEIERVRAQTPSALFAASAALWDLNLRARGRSLARHANHLAATEVAVNGLLDDGEPAEMAAAAEALASSGRTSIKIKVGVGGPERDVARIRAVCDRVASVSLRLDANGAWTADILHRVLPQLPKRRIEFVEQPLPVGQARLARELCLHYGFQLGLDEDVVRVEDAERAIERLACDILVLKPMLIGGIHACLHLARRAQDAGIKVIYTSSWESDIGVAVTLHLSAALGPHPPAMGLSTAGMISQGLVKSPLRIRKGHLHVPDGPGIGLDPAPELLEKVN